MKANPKVLIVSYQYPPIAGGGVPRPLKMSKYLPDYGFEPVILTVNPQYHVSLDQTLLEQIPKGTVIYRAKEWNPYERILRLRTGTAGKQKASATPSHAENSQARKSTLSKMKSSIFQLLKKMKNYVLIPDDHRFWIRPAIKLGLKAIREHNVDIIFSTSGPYSSHLVARALARKTGLPWIADFRDPWTQNMHRTGIPWRERLEEWMERSVMEEAAVITTVTKTFAANFLQKYPQIRRMEVIYNGYDPADFVHIEEKRTDHRLAFAYTGIFYEKRNPRLFLQAVSELIAEGKVRKDEIVLRFAGVFDYPGYTENQDAVRRFGLEDVVEVLGYLPHKESLSLLKSSDVLLLISDTAPGSEAYIPGKLYEYMAVERPILAFSLDGEAAQIIREFQLGKVVPPTDLSLMKQAIFEFVELWRKGNLKDSFAFAKDPEKLAIYQRDTQAEQLAQLMKEVVNQSK